MKDEELRMRVINLYHSHPDWSWAELAEEIWGDGSCSSTYPDEELTDNYWTAMRWFRRADNRRDSISYRVLFAHQWTFGLEWQPWPEGIGFFTRAKKVFPTRASYLAEKWRGSRRLSQLKQIVGEHLVRACRAEPTCPFKALLEEQS